MDKKIIIIGAGPAGLTAGLEILRQTKIHPIILEATNDIGGISKTVNYKGNRIDIGGHRFFSKSDEIMEWWKDIIPLQSAPAYDDKILKRHVILSKDKNALDPEKEKSVLLMRNRVSRILHHRKFFDYPISLNKKTFMNLGIKKIIKIGLSYIFRLMNPIKSEKTLEDFFINRFGGELYHTFFKDYTEKVWGVPCNKISAAWGAQRIKGLSITKTLMHALRTLPLLNRGQSQQKVETSLIENFLYPKLGPGQMWENVAHEISTLGGELNMNTKVIEVHKEDNKIVSVKVLKGDGSSEVIFADYFISTMPVKLLISSINNVPQNVSTIADGLLYRDFITVGVLLDKLKIINETDILSLNNIIPDNWIYIQETDVYVGRIQIFNNWSPYLLNSVDQIWIGLEYFCNEGDAIWSKNDEEMKNLALLELEKLGLILKKDVIDSVVIKMPKAYPAYFGTYNNFSDIRDYTDGIENLFLIGRNGMHKYNNMDHSMLTAMEVVKNIKNNVITKDNIWEVNSEKIYHEKK